MRFPDSPGTMLMSRISMSRRGDCVGMSALVRDADMAPGACMLSGGVKSTRDTPALNSAAGERVESIAKTSPMTIRHARQFMVRFL